MVDTDRAAIGETAAETTADIYWELDPALRFVAFSGRALAPAGIEPAEVLGKTPWQHGTFLEDPWAAHRAALRARQPFDDFVYRCLNSSGEVRYLSSSGRPVFDEKGVFLGYRGTAKDISEHKRMALRLSIEHSVARVLEEAQEIAPAMTEVIRIVCNALGWACGARRVGTSEGLRCAETWGIEAPGIAEFLAATREHAP
jgi:PAS domain S-box-containing protein